ncbi:hypothetical protein [Streptomyces sp. NPDC001978]|uniref:hypothetical protein n=1 Tax=Streptomyces sp. NPDC001978 TaxID=3364627 RepID=UPI0036AE670F
MAARELGGSGRRFLPVSDQLGPLAGVGGLAEQVLQVAPGGGLHVLVNNAGAAMSSTRLRLAKPLMFQSAGDIRAIRRMCSRTRSPIVPGRPPTTSGPAR